MTGWPASLWLVRHGQSVGNVARDLAYAEDADELAVQASDPDVELSDLGERQAAALGRWLATRPETAQLDALVVSPYRRARQTAQVVVDTAGLVLPVTRDERLRDREQGVLDRLTWKGWQSRYPEEARRREVLGKFYYRPPGGESWADVVLRIRAALGEMRGSLAGRHVLMVSHDVPILAVRYVLEELEIDAVVALSGQLANCSVTRYVAAGDADALVLERANDVAPVAATGIEVTADG